MFIAKSPRIYLPQHFSAAWYFDSMNLDGNGGTLGDFDAVSSIIDLTGNGNNLSQATGANQPEYRINTVNGSGNSIVFDGASRYLTAPNINYAGEITVMALVTLDDSTASRRFVSYGLSGGVSVGTPGSAGKAADMTLNSVIGVDTTTDFFGSGFVVITTVLSNILAGTWNIDFYKNGVLFQSAPFSSTGPVSSSDPFYLGGFDSSAAFWVGQIVMLAGWNRALTSWELNQMHLLFKTRGGLN